jgi:hypothetical protein
MLNKYLFDQMYNDFLLEYILYVQQLMFKWNKRQLVNIHLKFSMLEYFENHLEAFPYYVRKIMKKIKVKLRNKNNYFIIKIITSCDLSLNKEFIESEDE